MNRQFMKRYAFIGIAIILIIILALSCAYAEKSGRWGNLSWTLSDAGELVVAGTGDIADMSEGSSEAWRPYKDQIKTLVISTGITGVGDNTFSNCANLTSVLIPDEVKRIGSKAFYQCTSLISMSKSSYAAPENPEPADKVEAFVTRCYKLILGRNPDEGGLKDWCKQLKD